MIPMHFDRRNCRGVQYHLGTSGSSGTISDSIAMQALSLPWYRHPRHKKDATSTGTGDPVFCLFCIQNVVIPILKNDELQKNRLSVAELTAHFRVNPRMCSSVHNDAITSFRHRLGFRVKLFNSVSSGTIDRLGDRYDEKRAQKAYTFDVPYHLRTLRDTPKGPLNAFVLPTQTSSPWPS